MFDNSDFSARLNFNCHVLTEGSISLAKLGSVAEWSKALVYGPSRFDGVVSNSTTAIHAVCFEARNKQK